MIDQKRQQWTYRNGKAGKPGGDIIRLRTLERFTGIDNQRTRQRHLCQTQESALNQTHHHQHLEAHLDIPEGFQIIKDDETDCHTQDGYLAYPIATIALHQIGAEATQKKDAQAISSINHANLSNGISILSHKIRYAQEEHVDARHQEEIGEAETPEVTVPQFKMHRGILRIHLSSSLLRLDTPRSSRRRYKPLLPSASPRLPGQNDAGILA